MPNCFAVYGKYLNVTDVDKPACVQPEASFVSVLMCIHHSIALSTEINRSIIVVEDGETIRIKTRDSVKEAKAIPRMKRIKPRNKILLDLMVNHLDVLFVNLS